MIGNFTRIAYQIGEKVFHLYCEQNSTTAELKEIATQLIAHMCEIEKKIAEQQPQNDEVEVISKED